MLGKKPRLSRTPAIVLSLNGELINNVHKFKYCGMLIDPQLMFQTQIDLLMDNITNKLGLLYKKAGFLIKVLP